MYQFSYVKFSSTDRDVNLVLLDDPGRVRSQITSVVCQIQRFDFDCNLVARPPDARRPPRHPGVAGPRAGQGLPSGPHAGAHAPSAFSAVKRFRVALLYGRAGRLISQNGGSGPGQ